MPQTITYAVDRDSGEVVSHFGDAYAWPILDYEAIGKDGDYNAPFEYNLAKLDQRTVGRGAAYLYWTKRIPTEVKNLHRAFWGLPAVKPIANEEAVIERYWKRHARAVFGA